MLQRLSIHKHTFTGTRSPIYSKCQLIVVNKEAPSFKKQAGSVVLNLRSDPDPLPQLPQVL